MKFSIRDLLLVTVIVALAVAWWLDRSRLLKEVQTVERLVAFEKERAFFEKAIAEAVTAFAKVEADSAKSQEAWRKATKSFPPHDGAYGTEGPVRGYTLLGPPLPNPSAPAPNSPKQ